MIVFWTIFLLGPIPVVHILLHVFLRTWRKGPIKFYIKAVAVWFLVFFLARWLNGISDVIFTPPYWLQVLCIITCGSSLFLVVWSAGTLGPRRFFLWAVLRPQSVRQEKIGLGPYKYFHHPAYTAYLFAAFAAFFGTGRTVLLAFAAAMFLMMLIVMARENHELEERLGMKKNPAP
jgi:protein-S-isoprenylcysteine O-methyltransferase Ste14